MIQRERWTPIEAIFSSPAQTPTNACPSRGSARDAVLREGADQHLLEVAHVAPDVAPVGAQVDDRDSPRAVPARGR